MDIRRDAKSELGHDLVDREAEKPKFAIRIHERPVEVRVNQSIAEWEAVKAEIEEESKSFLQGNWGGIPSWDILIMIGGSLCGAGLHYDWREALDQGLEVNKMAHLCSIHPRSSHGHPRRSKRSFGFGI